MKNEFHYSDGTISGEYYANKILHSESGSAAIYSDGYKHWYINGKRHRTDGPAIEGPDGSKFWYVDDKLHRIDGPAAEDASGNKAWYVYDMIHRIDGPAIEGISGTRRWFIDGEEYNELDFHKFIENIKMLDRILQLTDERWWVRELGKQNLEGK